MMTGDINFLEVISSVKYFSISNAIKNIIFERWHTFLNCSEISPFLSCPSERIPSFFSNIVFLLGILWNPAGNMGSQYISCVAFVCNLAVTNLWRSHLLRLAKKMWSLWVISKLLSFVVLIILIFFYRRTISTLSPIMLIMLLCLLATYTFRLTILWVKLIVIFYEMYYECDQVDNNYIKYDMCIY